jgi:hypothetical protein
VLVAGGMLAPACLVPLVTLPGAIRIFLEVRATPEDPAQRMPLFADRAARLDIRFGALYAASVALSEMVWKRAV